MLCLKYEFVEDLNQGKYAVFMQQMIIPQSFVIYVTIKMEVLPLKYNFDGDEVFHIDRL